MLVKQRVAAVAPQFEQYRQLHPVCQRVLAARGVTTDAQLELKLASLHAPDTLKGLPGAVALMLDALRQQQRVLIVADYDADGATSCALGILGLKALGFRHVEFLVPNRFEFGYGLTPAIVKVALAQKPDVLMTVDNGIASHQGVKLAREHGIRVLITDHHLPADTVPEADAILNPNQPGCNFASKATAGVGVVFYLLLGLRKALREQGWFSEQKIPEPNLANLLDLVALGTVADVVPLDENNRRFVKHGLALIQQGRGRAGIRALLECAGRNPASCVANDLGFAAGPRLNAAGRLDDMRLGIECLLTDDAYEARQIALQLDSLNKDRKLIEQDMQEQALIQLDTLPLPEAPRFSLCLHDSNWHQGVIGILASRIKDRLHCPVLIFADAGVDEHGNAQIKGSARSITGVHIRDMLDVVATRHPDVLEKFGGHAMAAGLTIARANFDAFATALEQAISEHVAPELLSREMWCDGQLDRDCFSVEFATVLRNLAPWGQHFPEPVFLDEFVVLNKRVLADKHLKLTLQHEGSSRTIDAIAFNQTRDLLQQEGWRIKLLYKLDINEYRGELSPQLLIEHLQYL